MGVGMCETEGFVRVFAYGILLSSQERKPEASLSLSVCLFPKKGAFFQTIFLR